MLFVGSLPPAPTMRPKADGIVALTGGDERLDTAVDAAGRRRGRKDCLISGAALATTKEMVRNIAGGGKRFHCCADVGYAAEDTHGNAEEAATWAREHHFSSLVIVTGRHHMPRTLQEFSSVMPDITLVAYPVEQNGIDLASWWKHPRTAQLLHREYFKYSNT